MPRDLPVPGIYVPEDRIGTRVEQGAVLGAVIDALNGVIREEVRAPFGGWCSARGVIPPSIPAH